MSQGHRDDARARFERAFVATSYLLGRRGTELSDALVDPAIATRALAKALDHTEREARATALAPELARLVAALDARRLA